MKKQSLTLNSWKLIAALLIMGHHAILIGQSGDYIFHGAYVYTEFFFMISGYFLVRSLESGKIKGSMDYAKICGKNCSRIRRLLYLYIIFCLESCPVPLKNA